MGKNRPAASFIFTIFKTIFRVKSRRNLSKFWEILSNFFRGGKEFLKNCVKFEEILSENYEEIFRKLCRQSEHSHIVRITIWIV